MNHKYNFKNHLKESLKDPEFKKNWEKSKAEYQLSQKIIELRIEKKISQVELAKKAKTTQAIISRIESSSANPSFKTLKRIGEAFNCDLDIGFIAR